jgi:ABC-type nitrate/sulfonate/bicarbonate transport system permease component
MTLNLERYADSKYLPPLIGFVIVLALWWMISIFLDRTTVPSPLATLVAAVEILHTTPQLVVLNTATDPGIFDDMTSTMYRTYAGVSVGLVTGILTGVALGWSRVLRDFVEPAIELLRVIPPLVYIPFFVVWFGINTFSILGIVALATFLIIVINSLEAVGNVNETYKEFARTLGASDKTVYRSVVIPAIVPELTSGIRITLGLGWGLTIVGELLGAQVGMGVALSTWVGYSAATNIIAGILWISLVAVLTDIVVTAFIRKQTHWT